jgi:hypothetical protein
VHLDGRVLTVNVEYNYLDSVLKASGFAEGDANDATTGMCSSVWNEILRSRMDKDGQGALACIVLYCIDLDLTRACTRFHSLTPCTGVSRFPGSVNCLGMSLKPYTEALATTQVGVGVGIVGV